MNNPWLDLPTSKPYIARMDEEVVRTAPKLFSHLRLEIPPDPYLGNLDKAEIILLALNPGFTESDFITFQDDEYTKQNRLNLLHRSEPSMYVLDKKFDFSGGYQWWTRILKKLITDGVPIEVLGDKLMCLQYFPYHSTTYSHIPQLLPSQQYTFHLLNKAIENGKTIVIMRSRKLWVNAVPTLKHVEFIELKNPRNPVISPNNMLLSDYNRILSSLSSK